MNLALPIIAPHTIIFLSPLSLQFLEWVNIGVSCLSPPSSLQPDFRSPELLSDDALLTSYWVARTGGNLVLTAWQEETRAGEFRGDCSLSNKKVVPVPDWSPGVLSFGRALSAIVPPPTFFLLSSFFCPPFSSISFWVLGWYLILVLLLPLPQFFCFFASSLFLLRVSCLECGLWPSFSCLLSLRQLVCFQGLGCLLHAKDTQCSL